MWLVDFDLSRSTTLISNYVDFHTIIYLYVWQGAREENTTADMEKAKREAGELYSAGEKKWGTDESKFNHILATRSQAQLIATFEEYIRVCWYTIHIARGGKTSAVQLKQLAFDWSIIICPRPSHVVCFY